MNREKINYSYDMYQQISDQEDDNVVLKILFIIICIGLTILLGLVYLKFRRVYYENPSLISQLADYSAFVLAIAVFAVFLTGEDIDRELIIGSVVAVLSHYLFRWYFRGIDPTGSVYSGLAISISSYCSRIPVLATLTRIISPLILPVLAFVPIMLFGYLLKIGVSLTEDNSLSEHCAYLHNFIWIICSLCLAIVILLENEVYDVPLLEQLWQVPCLFLMTGILIILKETIYQ